MKNEGSPHCYGIWLARNGIGRKGTPPCGECLACQAAAEAVDADNLGALKKADLVELAVERGIVVDPKTTKAALIAALEAAEQPDDGGAEGDDDPVATDANDAVGDDEANEGS